MKFKNWSLKVICYHTGTKLCHNSRWGADVPLFETIKINAGTQPK